MLHNRHSYSGCHSLLSSRVYFNRNRSSSIIIFALVSQEETYIFCAALVILITNALCGKESSYSYPQVICSDENEAQQV